jgi:methyl-accepting chemotaxis protein
MLLRKVAIAPRAALGFGLAALLTLFLGIFSLQQMSEMHDQSELVDQKWLPNVLALNEVSQDILRLRAVTLRLILNPEPEHVQANSKLAQELREKLHEAQNQYEQRIANDKERAAYALFKQAEQSYLVEQAKIVTAVAAGDFSAARQVANGALNEHADAMAKALVAVSHLGRDAVSAAAKRTDTVYYSARVWVIGMILLAVLLTVVLAFLLTRSIAKPLLEALHVAEVVASGDLTQRIEVAGTDEPARLLAALKSMQGSLRSTIHSIAESSNQLASAAEELHAVSEDSTRGLHQQSNEIEQAATAVNEMTAAVEEVARNAVSTSEASRQSNEISQKGREQVRETARQIEELAKDVSATSGHVEQLAGRVHEISKVLDVIRAIAEQTNLLALNAAIEAARAGDAGRGFAVVADEVRALAHRTQQSTQEIEQMIGGIQQGTDQAVNAMRSSSNRVRGSLEVAHAAGDALEHIAQAIATINERNLVIASASEEQAQVAREVDRNLVNIRDLSMQTTTGADETNTACNELSRLAVDLNNLVTRFKV